MRRNLLFLFALALPATGCVAAAAAGAAGGIYLTSRGAESVVQGSVADVAGRAEAKPYTLVGIGKIGDQDSLGIGTLTMPLSEVQQIARMPDKITEIVTTGRMAYYDKLIAEVPPSLVELLRIPGLGPRTVRQIWLDLGVLTMDDLRQAAEAGRIRELLRLGLVDVGDGELRAFSTCVKCNPSRDAARALHRNVQATEIVLAKRPFDRGLDAKEHTE